MKRAFWCFAHRNRNLYAPPSPPSPPPLRLAIFDHLQRLAAVGAGGAAAGGVGVVWAWSGHGVVMALAWRGHSLARDGRGWLAASDSTWRRGLTGGWPVGAAAGWLRGGLVGGWLVGDG